MEYNKECLFGMGEIKMYLRHIFKMLDMICHET